MSTGPTERDRSGSDSGAEFGGDPACWAGLICPACGRMPDRPGLATCANCGEPYPPAA